MQTLTTEQRMTLLLAATPDTLRRVDRVLTGEPTEGATEPTDRRLLTIAQTARALNVSRTTVWRLLRDGRLPFIELRKGSRRIPSEAITALVKGGAA
ncbi:MAG: helix-turn-helix transcriptional regulator [Kiritimatiellia bacterium]|jgi:excisionase family DNA binding protein